MFDSRRWLSGPSERFFHTSPCDQIKKKEKKTFLLRKHACPKRENNTLHVVKVCVRCVSTTTTVWSTSTTPSSSSSPPLPLTSPPLILQSVQRSQGGATEANKAPLATKSIGYILNHSLGKPAVPPSPPLPRGPKVCRLFLAATRLCPCICSGRHFLPPRQLARC